MPATRLRSDVLLTGTASPVTAGFLRGEEHVQHVEAELHRRAVPVSEAALTVALRSMKDDPDLAPFAELLAAPASTTSK